MVGGAFLIELISAGRVLLEGKGRTAKVVVQDPTPFNGEPLQAAFTRLQGKRPLKPQDAVVRLGRKGKSAVYEELAARGMVAPRTKAWLFFSVTRHDVTSPEREALVTGVRRVLLDDAPPDAITGPLVGLLLAGNLLKVVVDGPDRKRAKKRAEAVTQGDWASAGVREAIKAAQAAIAVVAVTAATAGAAGSGG